METIEFEDGTLTVSGDRKAEHEEGNEGFHCVERSFGGFSRSLTLPQGIRIPKPEQRKPRRIEIGREA